MSFDPKEIRTREHGKFRLDKNGEVAVKVISEILEGELGDPLQGVNYKYVKATYPDAITEVYTFYDNVDDLNVLAIVTIKYLTSSKRDLDDVEYEIL